MSSFAFLVLCIQACLLMNAFSCQGAAIGPLGLGAPFGYGVGPYGFGAEYPGLAGCGAEYAGPFGFGNIYGNGFGPLGYGGLGAPYGGYVL